MMRIEWDQQKSTHNKTLRGRGFDDAVLLFGSAYSAQQSIRSGQRRWEVWGYIGGKEWLGVFEFMYDGSLRVVSLRRANKREVGKHYV